VRRWQQERLIEDVKFRVGRFLRVHRENLLESIMQKLRPGEVREQVNQSHRVPPAPAGSGQSGRRVHGLQAEGCGVPPGCVLLVSQAATLTTCGYSSTATATDRIAGREGEPVNEALTSVLRHKYSVNGHLLPGSPRPVSPPEFLVDALATKNGKAGRATRGIPGH
jgi:hypothetical protein